VLLPPADAGPLEVADPIRLDPRAEIAPRPLRKAAAAGIRAPGTGDHRRVFGTATVLAAMATWSAAQKAANAAGPSPAICGVRPEYAERPSGR